VRFLRRPRRGAGVTGAAEYTERTPFADAAEITRVAQTLARRRSWPELWELVCAVPVLDGVRAVRQIDLRRWWPPDPPGRELAARMADVDVTMVARVAETASREATATHRVPVGDASRMSFAARHAAVAVEGYEPPGLSRISVLDGQGEWVDIHLGDEPHFTLACLGPADVLAVRGTGTGAELVRYTDRGATVLGNGGGFAGARPVAVAQGFVVGLPLVTGGLVCGFDVPLHHVDLRWLGEVRTDVVAVDPTGTRVAFGGGRIAVLDWLMQSLIAEVRPPRGAVRSLVFTAPDVLVTAGSEGGLCRWELRADGEMHGVEVTAPRMSSLFAVPAWRVVGGRVDSDGTHAFYDSQTLLPVDFPRLWGDHGLGRQFVQALGAAPDGDLVVVSGHLWADLPGPMRSTDPGTVVHDLRHPLSWVTRPPASVSPTDLPALAAAVNGVGEGSLTAHHPVSDDERKILALVHAIAAYRNAR
jgi:hypothetical protein